VAKKKVDNGYAADAALTAVPASELTTAKNLAASALEKTREIERLEEVEIPRLKKEIAEILEDKLPTLMTQVGLTDFTIENGVKISVGMKVFAALPNKEKDPDGFARGLAYLEKMGGGDLAKRLVTVEFNKEDPALAVEAADLLREKFPDKPVASAVSVHWGTLTSWCREQLDKGKILELATLGGFAKIIASIKRPKGDQP